MNGSSLTHSLMKNAHKFYIKGIYGEGYYDWAKYDILILIERMVPDALDVSP
jgi:hypothetical protein